GVPGWLESCVAEQKETSGMFELVALMLLSQQPPEPFVEGMASYYTVASSSGVTASGERMRDTELTCAMREGEFGHYYLVVAANGRSVVVRLNDRGPYARRRVIDLSKAAMRELHPSQGLMWVKVYDLGGSPPSELAAKQ
ncbi:MAG TPA: septal ring lytic transglycosylase RlpA family protein, partial [Candidatus Hydrogenedentes bacterium]|nr:septal ring lytic transglycosylase RlpA family protein [Candidatus Hydrogenedentota bacterium]